MVFTPLFSKNLPQKALTPLTRAGLGSGPASPCGPSSHPTSRKTATVPIGHRPTTRGGAFASARRQLNVAKLSPAQTSDAHPTPEPSQIDYHADRQAQRVQAALKALDPGEILAVVDSKIAAKADPAQHPLYHLVCWHLEKCLTPLDGGQFFDTFRQLVIDAINVCLDEALSREDER
jgi:hypothetical protein